MLEVVRIKMYKVDFKQKKKNISSKNKLITYIKKIF